MSPPDDKQIRTLEDGLMRGERYPHPASPSESCVCLDEDARGRMESDGLLGMEEEGVSRLESVQIVVAKNDRPHVQNENMRIGGSNNYCVQIASRDLTQADSVIIHRGIEGEILEITGGQCRAAIAAITSPQIGPSQQRDALAAESVPSYEAASVPSLPEDDVETAGSDYFVSTGDSAYIQRQLPPTYTLVDLPNNRPSAAHTLHGPISEVDIISGAFLAEIMNNLPARRAQLAIRSGETERTCLLSSRPPLSGTEQSGLTSARAPSHTDQQVNADGAGHARPATELCSDIWSLSASDDMTYRAPQDTSQRFGNGDMLAVSRTTPTEDSQSQQDLDDSPLDHSMPDAAHPTGSGAGRSSLFRQLLYRVGEIVQSNASSSSSRDFNGNATGSRPDVNGEGSDQKGQDNSRTLPSA